jgi:DNA-binding IclR family transcriptional regulator
MKSPSPPQMKLRILPPELAPIVEKKGGHTYAEMEQLREAGLTSWDEGREMYIMPVVLPVRDASQFESYCRDLGLSVPTIEFVKLKTHIRKHGTAIVF